MLKPTSVQLKNDILTEIFYENLNFEYAVGGSYALQQYTKAGWEPNDIDIFVNCGTLEKYENKIKFAKEAFEHFKRMVNEFIEKNKKIKIVKEFRDLKQLCEEEEKLDMTQERFSEHICGTITIEYPGVDKKIQFVGVFYDKEHIIFDVLLERMCDLPSCITYRMDAWNNAIFNVPEAYKKIINNVISKGKTCSLRMEKYEKRGYKYE